jgi:hypothetical protein
MTTKRTRRARGHALPAEVVEVLGFGGGMHSYTTDWLAQQWQLYGEQLREYWMRRFGKDVWLVDIAEREGWKSRRLPEVVVKLKRDLKH